MQVVLSLGTNQGDRVQYLKEAVIAIQNRVGDLISQSKLYETAAWGVEDQADFINQTILVDTNLAPSEVLQTVLEIELDLGRVRVQKWGPRVIDIDILFYEQEIIDTPDLKIPHPHISKRNFVLLPTMEIIPNFIHPVSQLSIEELYLQSEDKGEVFLLEE